MRKDSTRRHATRQLSALAILLALSLGLTSTTVAQQPLTREAAVHQALAQNPSLATVRKQCGYAETALIIAKTYPFNPVYTGYAAYNSGQDVTNRVYLEHYVSLELELRGQKRIRKAVAAATVSRIDWEIAHQEIVVSIATIRAYNTVLYRQKKIDYIDASIKTNEQAYEQLRKKVEAGAGKAMDLMLARIDLDSARAQRGQIRTALAVARSELRRQLGTLDDTFMLAGDLDVPLASADPDALTQLALGQRADLQARRSAICEAEAALRLVVANRFGNPSFGPFYEYDPTKVTTMGARWSMPLAVFNSKKAEIHKAETDVTKIRSEVQQVETQASQEVQAALGRLTEAGKWAAAYQTDVIPNLVKAKDEVEKQLANKDPNVDQARLWAIQRSFIKANENLLDALYEVSQAQADLALSTAEPSLAIGPGHVQTQDTRQKAKSTQACTSCLLP
jgi:outer membrane protein TolC